MLTLFAVPKPFRGHIAVIQKNAIRSWTLLEPQCRIILFGHEEGVAETVAEYGISHVREVAVNEYGTPLINDIFEKAHHLSSTDLLCYVNADIILMSDFMEALQRTMRLKRKFLMVGRRWDLDIKEPLKFEGGWESALRQQARTQGELHAHSGIDYFAFSRGLWATIPPFAVGRPVWDNWMIYSARTAGIPVIDATEAVTCIHQNHDYCHVSGGVIEAQEGVEAQRNLALAGGYDTVYTLDHVNWLLTNRSLKPAWTSYHLSKRIGWLARKSYHDIRRRIRSAGG